MIVSNRTRGFTLVEAMLTIFFVGVLAALTLPKVSTSASGNWLFLAKNMASQLQNATIQHAQNNPTTPPTDTEPISDLLHYMQKRTAGNLVSAALTCSGGTPCYRFPDGGVLIALNNWGQCGATAATMVGSFHYDPDGTGRAGGLVLCADYNNARVVTQDSYFNTPSTNAAHVDPSYVRNWTQL